MGKKVFSNPNPNIKPKNWVDVLKWKLTSKTPAWPKYIPLKVYDTPPKVIDDNRIRLSFVGHATFLIQTYGINILTDPVWSDRASPFSFIGPKRITPPGIKFDDLPKIDLILISHNHYDHLDIETVRKLWQRDKPKIITPLMNDIVLKSNIVGIEVKTLNWFEYSIANNFKIILEPAQHWSARSLFDKNNALWGTFIIQTPDSLICFIGDSGYSKEIFEEIGKKYQDIKLSIVPIGAFAPRWFMQGMHMNPEEAILVHQHLNSKYSVASHFQTFKLADDSFEQAVTELAQARLKYKIPEDRFIILQTGCSSYF